MSGLTTSNLRFASFLANLRFDVVNDAKRQYGNYSAERNGTKVSSRGQLGQNKSLLLCFNTMLKKIFWSNVGAIGPKYGIIKAKLDELPLIL